MSQSNPPIIPLDWKTVQDIKNLKDLIIASVQAFYGPRFLNAFTYDILIRQDAQGFQIAEAILYTKPFFAEHTVLIHSRSKEAKAAMEGLWYQIQHDLKIGIQKERTTGSVFPDTYETA